MMAANKIYPSAELRLWDLSTQVAMADTELAGVWFFLSAFAEEQEANSRQEEDSRENT